MTGYGDAKLSKNGVSVSVEIKTLNGKFFDLYLKYPPAYSEFEPDMRKTISETLMRGKVAVTIEEVNETETVLKQRYNEVLFAQYYARLEALAEKVGAPKNNLFELALRCPDVIVNAPDEYTADPEFRELYALIVRALAQCDDFRIKEGEVLQKKLLTYVESINSALAEVETLDSPRLEKIRNRIEKNLQTVIDEERLNENRLEQEMIYYIEKLDITEEKVRLRNHLEHFKEVTGAEQTAGKKLGFIAQEMGREINTIGSKANDAGMQRHVVIMKEELEKIKEQLLNVL